jgi:hypothetical protein
VDQTPQFQGDLPTVLSQTVQVRAEQPGLLFLRTEQCLCHEGKGGQRRALFGYCQGDVGSGTLLGKERASQRAPEKSSEQLGPALVCRRLTRLHGLRGLAALHGLRGRADVERVEAETEPRTEPQGRGAGRGRERSVLTFRVEHPAVPPETQFAPDKGLQDANRCFVGSNQGRRVKKIVTALAALAATKTTTQARRAGQ